MAARKLEQLQAELEPLSRRYDVVVANPPYMGSNNMNGWLANWTRRSYPDAKRDLCTCFIERGFTLANECGYEALITSDTCMYISSFEQLRRNILSYTTIITFIDTRGTNAHPDVFDANAGWVLHNKKADQVLGSYFKLSHPIAEKEERFLEALANPKCDWAYKRSADAFVSIPGCPIAYWASNATVGAFTNTLLGNTIPVKKGLDTGDNDKFLRLWHEVSVSKIGIGYEDEQSFLLSRMKWAPHDKGGEFRRWYGNKEWIINWDHNGAELRTSSANLRSEQYYFRKAITWSSLSSGLCSFRLSDHGAISNTAGSSMYPPPTDQLLYLGLMNSSVVQHLLSFLAPTLNYSAGPVSLIPKAEWAQIEDIRRAAFDCVSCSKHDWDAFEISWDFKRHPLL